MERRMLAAMLGLVGCTPAVSETQPGATTGQAPETSSSAIASSGTSSTSSTSGTSGTSTTASGSTGPDTPPGCVSWCDGFPVNPGCDESESGGSGGADDTGLGMGGDTPLGVSVFAIQQGEVELDSFVSVADVVATSPVVAAASGGGSMFTVSDPAGGPYSGITVRVSGTPDELSIVPGDQVTIVAELRSRYIFSELHAYPEWITVNGEGVEPPALELDAQTLLGFADGGMDVKPFEAVLVSLPATEAEPGGCAGELGLSVGVIRVDDRFLAAAGQSLPPDTMLAGVRGPLLYTLNGFEVAPRSLSDFAP